MTMMGAMLPSAAAAQAPGSLSSEKCLVEGRVVRAGSGEPLRRAQVTLTPIARNAVPMRALTDADGRFSFQGVDPGRYRMVAERNGYLRMEFGQAASGRGGTPLELSAGQRRNDILFRLIPWGVISGRVYDEEGEPVVRGNVQVYRSAFQRGRRTLTRVQSVQTNDRGEYRVFGLVPGRYFLSAQHAGGSRIFAPVGGGAERAMVVTEIAAAMAPGGIEPDEAYAPTFYPGTTEPGRAAPVEVPAGAEVNGLDFTLTPVPTVRVRGTVVNSATNSPARNVSVWLFPRDSGDRAVISRMQTMVQAGGEFEIRGVVPGSYYVAANWTDRNQMYTARQSVEVGGSGLEGVTLFLQPGASLEGTVRVEGGDLDSLSHTMTVQGNDGPQEVRVSTLRVALMGADDSPAGNSNTQVRADGTFQFRNLAPGTYHLVVTGGNNRLYLKEARLGGRDVLQTGIDLSGPVSARLEVVVSAEGGRVEGMVLSAENLPAGGSIVALVPEAQFRHLPHLYRVTTADSFGRFDIEAIAPGTYHLYAWDELEPGAHMDPDLLRADEQRSTKIQVAARAGATVEITVIPANGRVP